MSYERVYPAREAGLSWYAREAALLLRKAGKRDACAEIARETGQAAACQPITDLFRPEAPWERTLRALKGVREGGADPTAATESDHRMVWRLYCNGPFCTLEPREQKRTKRGDWTKGRAVSLERLYQQQDSFDYLSPQDRRICRQVEAETVYEYFGHYPRTSYSLNGDQALLEAIGHPLLFWADEARSLQPEPPSTLQAQMRDYQLEGFRWLARLAHWGAGACLADDMGLGKTVQALALILTRSPAGPSLVLAPTSVCTNWLEEAARFAPTLRAQRFGPGDRQQMLDRAGPFDLIVCSYGLMQSESERLAAVTWNSVVADEAQAIKNPQTKRSKAAMALQADFRMLATGTPIENHLCVPKIRTL